MMCARRELRRSREFRLRANLDLMLWARSAWSNARKRRGARKGKRWHGRLLSAASLLRTMFARNTRNLSKSKNDSRDSSQLDSIEPEGTQRMINTLEWTDAGVRFIDPTKLP